MTKHLKIQLALTTLLFAVGSTSASAMSIRHIADAHSAGIMPIVNVHGLHGECLEGPLSPSNTVTWHRNEEAGVHLSCTPRVKPGGGGKLTLQPKRNNSGNTLKLGN